MIWHDTLCQNVNRQSACQIIYYQPGYS